MTAVGRVEILGVPVSTASLEETTEAMLSWAIEPASEASPRYVCATNVHGLTEGSRDASFREILKAAALVVPDGMPLVWVGRALGHRSMTLVPGPTLMTAVCSASAGTSVRHFFYGGKPGVADDLARTLEGQVPGLRVAGTYCPPFRPQTDEELTHVAQCITDSGADIVWVGLGTPKQERWIARILPRLRVRMLCSVGAAFDFHTGRARQPPTWVQEVGLGWFFRLLQDPRRLWIRYARNNPLFVWLALRQLLSSSATSHAGGGGRNDS